MADSPEEIRKSVRIYLLVGLILFAGTVATVLVATVPWLDIGEHGFDMWDCILGLAIATTKASFVAAVFMHLNHEKKAVYWVFGSGLVFAAFLVALIGLAKSDPIHDPLFYGGATEAQIEDKG
ncbi:MAG: cytochrome C oxidase subunit IV family protein [Verrucomicrobiales bacterium]|nr:cytochrome C oxidase subunit IV family protein [Verrucomicrobiota bacterium JB025]